MRPSGGLVHRRPPGRDAFGHEGLLEIVAHEVGQLVDEAPEAACASARQQDEARTIRVGEVVDVAVVLDARAGGAQLLEQPAHERHPPGAREAAHVDVLSAGATLQAEAERLDRRVLPDHAARRLDVRGGAERQPSGVAAPPQRLDGERRGRDGRF